MKKEERGALGPHYADIEFWILLRQTYNAFAKANDETLKDSGISRVQSLILYLLKTRSEPTTSADISRWLFREPHTVTTALNRMEAQGLVRRVRDMPRKNLVRIELTHKGNAAFQLSTAARALNGKVMSVLSDTEIANIRAGLEKLRDRAIEEIPRR